MSCPRVNFSRYCELQQNLYYNLRSYVPAVLQSTHQQFDTPQSQPQPRFPDQCRSRLIRRRSCYCSECGQLSTFQFKTIHVPLLKVPQRLRKKKTIIKRSSTQFEELQSHNLQSPLLKKRNDSPPIKSLKHAIHLASRMRKSLLLTTMDEKFQFFTKQSRFSSKLPQSSQQPLSSQQPQSSQSKQLIIPKCTQHLRTLTDLTLNLRSPLSNNTKSVTHRSPMESHSTSNKKYLNIYLTPLKTKTLPKTSRILSKSKKTISQLGMN